MSDPAPPALLDQLDTRQDDVLRRLDELNQQIEELIAQHTPSALTSAGPSAPTC